MKTTRRRAKNRKEIRGGSRTGPAPKPAPEPEPAPGPWTLNVEPGPKFGAGKLSNFAKLSNADVGDSKKILANFPRIEFSAKIRSNRSIPIASLILQEIS